ncbi:MAG: hypothetical protein EZS28_035878 [Streblomastix strix]|uniref:Uncharacterized protein n=1 Tax=Streblomastix strix TaxID=222440 RepID=A0A5J4UCS1_9EUKA|nr:MAG: hypothetical protein EZS28_035878 [Streblomastix strix]
MKRLTKVGYVAFRNSQLGEIPDDTNDDVEQIFTVLSENIIKAAKQKRDEKRANEEKQFQAILAKKGIRQSVIEIIGVVQISKGQNVSKLNVSGLFLILHNWSVIGIISAVQTSEGQNVRKLNARRHFPIFRE